MRIVVCALAAFLAASSACLADALKATPTFTESEIKFEPGGKYSNYTLTVTGPHGFHARVAAKDTIPSLDLKGAGASDDGVYHYQLTASTDTTVPLRAGLDDGRPTRRTAMQQGVAMSGHFELKGGAIVKLDPNAREDVKRQK